MLNKFPLQSNTDDEVAIIEEYLKSTWKNYLVGDIEHEIIDHPDDFDDTSAQKSFILKMQKPEKVLKFIMHFEMSEIIVYFNIQKDYFNQSYISKITFKQEIPYNYYKLGIIQSLEEISFSHQNSKVESALNSNRKLIRLLRDFFITQAKIGNSVLSLSPSLITDNERTKTFLLISNLPVLSKNNSISFKELDTITLINSIIEVFEKHY